MPSAYEVASRENVPAIRAHIAKQLVKRYGMREVEVAHILGVAQAAVSKYISGKYSAEVKEAEAKIDTEMVGRYLPRIAEGRGEFVVACICRGCQMISPFNCAFCRANEVEV